MKKFTAIAHLRLLGIMVAVMAGQTIVLFAQSATQPAVAMDPGYLKTNGEYVTIGRIMVKTNSPLNTDEFKQFKWRDDQLMKINNSGVTNANELVTEGAWALIQDYPNRANGYQLIMMVMENYERKQPDQARALAAQFLASSAPEKYKLWTKGFLNRLDARNHPVSLQFTAVDGRNVDLAQMRGKVVLVDFWGTHCGPCVAELPRIKTALEKFHAQGFEIIGISCDTDQKELEQYVKKHDLSWPQYFDGKQQSDNQFTVAFGIDGIPHMFLVDRKGCLRFDDVRAKDATFEDKISKLLDEKMD